MTRIAVIPARIGSKRISRKNLRFLGNKPLVQWVIETARDSKLFDEVYLNSESYELKQLAIKLGVQFYHRNAKLATDSATSEHFITDFLNNVECDELFQITPTSPFLTVKDLEQAASYMDKGAHTVLSVKRIQAECFIDGNPINFNPTKPMLPSQELPSVFMMCNGIFVWNKAEFLENGDAATYGGEGHTALLLLEGNSTLDIDTEDDFQLAEAILAKQLIVTRYWSPTEYTEYDAGEVLINDGVKKDINLNVNGSINIEQLLNEISHEGGARRVVQRLSNCATVISQMPEEGNRRHYHPDWDEWWLILEGEYEYEIENNKTLARKGDLISISRGQWHQIRAIGDSRATRLAVSKDRVAHVYSD